MTPSTSPELRPRLHGRGNVSSRLAAGLGDLARGRGGALLVLGPAGSGRTSVLDDAVRRAPEDVRVVQVHPAPADQRWGLDIVAELAHRLRAARPLRPPALDRVLDAAVDGGSSPGPVAAALTALLAEAADPAPLALFVDDADQLDEHSRTVLAAAVRRLADDPVLIVLAGGRSLGDEITGVPVEQLHPLGFDDAASLLADAAGRPVAPAVRDLLVELSEGRPAVLVELVGALSGEELAGRAPLADPLPVGPLLEKGALRAFRGMGDDELQLLRLLAVAGDLPVGSLTPSAHRAPVGWLDEMEAAGVVLVDEGRVRLRDRIASAALAHQLDGPSRRAAHAEVAARLPETDPARIWHRAAASPGPDDEVADALAEEAERARRRGALVTSAAWWERAAALTEEAGERAVRLLAAAGAHLAAGHPAPIEGLLGASVDARALLPEGPVARRVDAEVARVEALLALRSGSVDEAMGLLSLVAGQLAQDSPTKGAAALLDAVPAVLRAARPDRVAELLDQADVLLGKAVAGDEEVALIRESARLSLARAALDVARRGPEAGTAELEESARVVAADASAMSFAAECAGLALIWAERYERAAVLLDVLERRARVAGAPAPLATIRSLQALGSMRRGRLRDAAVAASEAVASSDEPEAAGIAPFALSILAAVEAQRGEEAGCRRAAERLLEHAASSGDRRWEVPARAATGLLALGHGRPEEAVHEMSPLLSAPVTAPWVVMWQGDLVEALVRSGRTIEATELLATLDRRGTWSSGRAASVRERLAGLVADDADTALVHLERAAVLSSAAGAELGRARARLAQGQVLRRVRRRAEARVALDDARLAFGAAGAEPWAGVAATELAACGVGAATAPSATVPAGVLTPQELQVARLVAAGSTNREVADRLFVSVRTVESHLGRIYRKLGVRSRSALAARSEVLRDGLDPS